MRTAIGLRFCSTVPVGMVGAPTIANSSGPQHNKNTHTHNDPSIILALNCEMPDEKTTSVFICHNRLGSVFCCWRCGCKGERCRTVGSHGLKCVCVCFPGNVKCGARCVHVYDLYTCGSCLRNFILGCSRWASGGWSGVEVADSTCPLLYGRGAHVNGIHERNTLTHERRANLSPIERTHTYKFKPSVGDEAAVVLQFGCLTVRAYLAAMM